MGFTLTVNHPEFPPETVFSVNYLGAAPNGSSFDVDEEQERAFITAYGVPVDQAFANNPTVTLSGSSTLTQADIDKLLPTVAAAEAPAPQAEAATAVIPPTDTGGDQSSG